MADEPPYLQQLSELIQAGDYATAYNETQQLLTDRPNDVLLLRIKGICLMETAYHDAAVLVLREALALDGESVATRYYLAQALAYRGSVLEAISLLEQVVAMAPGTEYAARAQQILPQLSDISETLAAVPDVRRWNLYFRTALEYDDNVPLAANESTDSSPTDSFRLTYSLYGELRLLDQKIDPTPLTLGLAYSLNGSEYERNLFSDYDLFSQRVSVFADRDGDLRGKPYNARLEAEFNTTELGSEHYSDITTLSLSLQYFWHDKVASTLSTSWLDKDYENASAYQAFYSRDSNEFNIGLQNHFYLMDNKMILGLHYNYRDNDAEGSQYELRSNDLTGSASLALPWKLRWSSQIAYQQEDYPEYRPTGRLDNVWTVWTALERPLDDTLTLELSYTHATADSNHNISDYRRNVIAVAVSARF